MSKPVNKFAQADLISTTLKAIGRLANGFGSPLLTVAIDLNLKQLSYLRNVLGQATVDQAAKAQANINAKFSAGEFGKETADQVLAEGQKVVFLQDLAEALHVAYKRVRDAQPSVPLTGEDRFVVAPEASKLAKAERDAKDAYYYGPDGKPSAAPFPGYENSREKRRADAQQGYYGNPKAPPVSPFLKNRLTREETDQLLKALGLVPGSETL